MKTADSTPNASDAKWKTGLARPRSSRISDVGEAEAHQREQALLDMARGVGQRVAAVERMADLEEHQQRREQHAERVADAHGQIVALALQHVPAARKASAGTP